jgi:hypothetical protein
MEQKTHVHVEVKLHGFLTSAVVGSEWRVSHLNEIVCGTNALGWVEPRAGVDGVEKRENVRKRLESKPGSSIPESSRCAV